MNSGKRKTPTQIVEALGMSVPQADLVPLKEPRFVRIALFDIYDESRCFNGLGVQLTGNDMYGGVILLKTLEETRDFSDALNEYMVLSDSEWNGGDDLQGDLLTEAQDLFSKFVESLPSEPPVTKSPKEIGKEMLNYQDWLAKSYKYEPIHATSPAGNVRGFYEEKLPDWCKTEPTNIDLYSPDGTLLSHGYTRVVIGDYGAFVEISPEQIVKGNIKVKPGEEYRFQDPRYASNVKYNWLTARDNSDCKIYFQKKIVTYADYKPGMFYISPYEVFLERDFKREKASRHQKQGLEAYVVNDNEQEENETLPVSHKM